MIELVLCFGGFRSKPTSGADYTDLCVGSSWTLYVCLSKVSKVSFLLVGSSEEIVSTNHKTQLLIMDIMDGHHCQKQLTRLTLLPNSQDSHKWTCATDLTDSRDGCREESKSKLRLWCGDARAGQPWRSTAAMVAVAVGHVARPYENMNTKQTNPRWDLILWNAYLFSAKPEDTDSV